MSKAKSRSGRSAPRPWQPMYHAVKVEPSEAQVARARASAAEDGWDPDEMEALLRREVEMWRNDRYVAVITRRDDGSVRVISLRRRDRKPDMPWRHMQWIKNEIAGPEVEAFELFPAESRLVDTANQRWLWVMSPGERVPCGFTERHVSGPEEAARYNARQS